jgi:trehalose-6-phosphate synthase
VSSLAQEGGEEGVLVKAGHHPPPAALPTAVTRVLEPLRCIPVFLPPTTHRAFYDGYCRDTLWPIFHNVIDVYGAYVCYIRSAALFS